MKILDTITLCEALDSCNNNNGYTVAILFNRWYTTREFIKEFSEIARDTPIPGLLKIHTSINNNYIEFENGSKIRIYAISNINNIRGVHCNEVICNADIDFTDATLCEAIRTMFIPYVVRKDNFDTRECIYESEENDDYSMELDEFLNLFSITE